MNKDILNYLKNNYQKYLLHIGITFLLLFFLFFCLDIDLTDKNNVKIRSSKWLNGLINNVVTLSAEEKVEVKSFSWVDNTLDNTTKYTSDRKIIYVQILNGENVKKFLPYINLRYTNPDASTKVELDHKHYVTWYYRHFDNPEEDLKELTDDTELEEGEKYYFLATPGIGFAVGTNVAEATDYRKLNISNISEEKRHLELTVKKSDIKPSSIKLIGKETSPQRTNYDLANLNGDNVIRHTNGAELMGAKERDGNQSHRVIANLPLITIGYINPDVPNGEPKYSSFHTHYAIWYYRHFDNPEEELKELTDSINLKPGKYYFVAIPGEGATIKPESGYELEDYTRIDYTGWAEKDRSLIVTIESPAGVQSSQWKWRYTYDVSDTNNIKSDFYYLNRELYGGTYPEELKTIYTMNPDGITGSDIKNSLPGLTLYYTNPDYSNPNPNFHWHNIKWYYYLTSDSSKKKYPVEDTSFFRIGEEYNFVAELAENLVSSYHNDGGLTDYTRLLPYPDEVADETKRTLNIKIANYDSKVEVSDLKWIDSSNIKYELSDYLKNEISIYSKTEVENNKYLFTGKSVTKLLPNFLVSYVSPKRRYDLFKNYKTNYTYQANWQYRKEGEDESANQLYDGSKFILECDENHFCGKYIFTATVGSSNDNNSISNSSLLDFSNYQESYSITLSFYNGDYFESNTVQSAIDSYDLTVNMFDYWLTGKNDADTKYPSDYWNYGINKGHVMLFMDGSDQGWLNSGSGVGAVQKKLDKDGYPVLNNLDFSGIDWAKDRNTSESLAYLFNPAISHDGKESYTNIKGLFQKNEKGYYYYDYTQNSASFQRDSNGNIPSNEARITLYNKPTISNERNPMGEFYPFNSIYEFFNENGELKDFSKRSSFVNHYFGLTLEVPFRQAPDGRITLEDGSKENMTFEFSGDDDVYVFIDDVLVLDLGSLGTSEGSINFATGTVKDLTGTSNLKTIFEAAGIQDILWKGNTFADNTTHTLKMFYLERANGASTLQIKFNLRPLSSNKIKKIDFNNKPIKDVVFNLYDSNVKGDKLELVSTLTTNEQGEATFRDTEGKEFDFHARNGKQYYLLEEKKASKGYRTNPEKILIKYDEASKSLRAVSPYTSGITTTFDINIKGTNDISYKKYDSSINDLLLTNDYLDSSLIKEGLVLAVPMIKKGNNWVGLYSNNIDGYSGVIDDDFTKTILMAALYQVYYNDSSSWKVTWDESKNGVDTLMTDIPGSADRYIEYNPDGDMRLEYIMISKDILNSLGISENTTEEFHKSILTGIIKNTRSIDAVIALTADNIIDFANNLDKNFDFVHFGSTFDKIYNSTIIIPNKERELKVKKVDVNGKPLSGAMFSIFSSLKDAEEEVNAVATGTTDSNGMLSFKNTVSTNNIGVAHMIWPGTKTSSKYYLKEIETNKGYIINETIVPIIIDEYSISADAGDSQDGISVTANIGNLAYNMRQYASAYSINITLRDVIATFQKYNKDTNEWTTDSRQKLYYIDKNNGYYECDYNDFIKTETSFVKITLSQDYDYEEEIYHFKDKVDGNLTGLFDLVNTVEVQNIKQNRKISGIVFEDINKNNKLDDKDILLKNIKVSLVYKNKKISTETDKDGYYEFSNLQHSEYVAYFTLPDYSIVVEKGLADDSSKVNSNGKTDSIKFENNEEETQEINFINLGLRSMNLSFTKISENDESSPILNDGLFELYEYVCSPTDESYIGKLVSESPECFVQHGDSLKTDFEGKIIFTTLKDSTYRLVEKEAPNGFVKPSGEWNIKVEKTNNDEVNTKIECVGGENRTCPAFKQDSNGELYLTNTKVIDIPDSGGIGRIIYTSLGVIMMGLSLLYFKKKEIMTLISKL